MAVDSGDGPEIPRRLEEALERVDARTARDIAETVVLNRDHPAWAVWRPEENRPWTAVRPASRRAPDAEQPMIWTHAPTAESLAARMRAADAQLAPRRAAPEPPASLAAKPEVEPQVKRQAHSEYDPEVERLLHSEDEPGSQQSG